MCLCKFSKIVTSFIRAVAQLKERAELPENGVLVEKRVFDEENSLPFEKDSKGLVVSSLK